MSEEALSFGLKTKLVFDEGDGSPPLGRETSEHE